MINLGRMKQNKIIRNTLRGTYFEGADIISSNIKRTARNSPVAIASGELCIRLKGKDFKLVFKSDKTEDRGGWKVEGYIDAIYGKDIKGKDYTGVVSPFEIRKLVEGE